MNACTIDVYFVVLSGHVFCSALDNIEKNIQSGAHTIFLHDIGS